MKQEPFTVVTAVNNRQVLQANLLRSPGLCGSIDHQVLIKEGFRSASLAYNSAIEEARHDLMLFVHQDVYLPQTWFSDVARAIGHLDREGINWGVLGSYGARNESHIRGVGRIYTTGLGFHGHLIHNPEPIETLDEITLICRKSSGLHFDPLLPYFHMYGVDLCLTAQSKGRLNYAIPAPCVHNTNQILILPDEFYDCYWYVKRKWRRFLPIQTSCIEISRFDTELRRRKVREFIARKIPDGRIPMRRIDDPRAVFFAENNTPPHSVHENAFF